MVPADTSRPEARPRLWNLNFFLLWQGQLVSSIGDTAYGIALGFWVLARTGSTALMGTLMAASVLPRVVVSPFAGVLVDRIDRKWILVLMDLIRGIAIIAVAVAAYAGVIEVWMVFAAGILLGVCGAFFNPAVGSAIPDIAPRDRLVQANSAFSMVYTGSGILGNSAGGFLFQALGAPLLFLINGLSYVFSAVTEIFIRIPRIVHERIEFRFVEELKDGLRFVWQYRGIRYTMAVAAALNFFAMFGFTLLLPLFDRTPGLGPGLYGIQMAGFTGGMFGGFLLASLVRIPPRHRVAAFVAGGMASCAAAALIPLVPWFGVMLVCGIFFGLLNAVINAFVQATFQAAVPQTMRGKVFSLMGTVAGGLTPLAMAFAGVAAEFVSIRTLIAAAFFITVLLFGLFGLSRPARGLIGFDPESGTLESIR